MAKVSNYAAEGSDTFTPAIIEADVLEVVFESGKIRSAFVNAAA
jgi:hypothetical protein